MKKIVLLFTLFCLLFPTVSEANDSLTIDTSSKRKSSLLKTTEFKKNMIGLEILGSPLSICYYRKFLKEGNVNGFLFIKHNLLLDFAYKGIFPSISVGEKFILNLKRNHFVSTEVSINFLTFFFPSKLNFVNKTPKNWQKFAAGSYAAPSLNFEYSYKINKFLFTPFGLLFGYNIFNFAGESNTNYLYNYFMTYQLKILYNI